jgi:AbrB family looped-hinge helix DNA binding protein
MTTTIDHAGRVVVPKALRVAAQLRPGSRVEVGLEEGRIVIAPATLRVRVEMRDGVHVLTAAEPVPRLSTAAVTAATERLRAERE